MTDARVLLAFAGLVVLALFYIERGMAPAFAPFSAVGTVVLWLTAFGCFGALRLGGWLLYAAMAVAAVWLVWRWAVAKRPRPALGFAFWFFVVCSVLIMLVLWLKKPMFTSWDEFSFWGTAGKLMKCFDVLPTVAPVGWIWPQPQTPGLPVFSYFFQFFGAGFEEWQTYLACDVFLFATMASVLAPFGRKAWVAAVPAGLACLLTPYIFQHYGEVLKVSPVYLDSLADIPMGFAFAAALACWFGAKTTGDGAANAPATGRGAALQKARASLGPLVPLFIALGTLTLIKDIAVGLALVVCALVLVDGLFTGRPDAPRLKQRVWGSLARFALLALVVGLVFIGWSAYTSNALSMDRTQDAGGKLGVGLQDIPLLFLKDLFAPEKTEFFTTITSGMVKKLFTPRNTMLGSGAMVAVGILALVAAAALLAKNRWHRRRCVVYGIFSTLGFLCYYLLITMLYLYLFRPEQSLAFESYERYIYPYTIGWLLGAVLLLGVSASSYAGPALRGVLAKGVLLALAGVMFVRVAMLVPAQYTVLGVNPSEYNERRAFAKNVQSLRTLLPEGGRTFYVKSGDLGLGWFMTCYELLPWQLDYSVGGGDLEERTNHEDGTRTTRLITAEELEEYLYESECDRVYVEYADWAFKERYGELFSDGLQGWFDDETDLYAVVRGENGTVSLEPVNNTRPRY